MALIQSPGGYSFMPGIPFLSFGVRAAPGFHIRRAVLASDVPSENAVNAALAWLDSIGRPASALCGFEFREYADSPMTRMEFDEFNRAYVDRLRAADLLVDGKVPLTRTNVVASVPGRSGSFLHAFSYTVPSVTTWSTGFVLSAIPEVRFRQSDGRLIEEVVEEECRGSASMVRKLAYVLDVAAERLVAMKAADTVDLQVQFYQEGDLDSASQELLLARLPQIKARGWTHVRAVPPIGPAVIELDFRCVEADEWIRMPSV